MSIYFSNSWKPVPHQIVKDDGLKSLLHGSGYSISKFSDNTVINELRKLYDSMHNIRSENGGMFYSVYSQDLVYRKKVHDRIAELLHPFLETHFFDYKVVLNSFVVKESGPKSEFYLHQDTTGLDEWKYSPLSLWIPLQNVDEKNGCLGVIPFSQHFFTPYRSISFPAPFDEIQSTAKQYLVPLRMRVGEVLIFDNRMLHHSYANSSGKSRVAVICGLFPREAKLITCHKPVYECGGKVELIEHDDDYLLKGKNFLIDCQKRPEDGKSLGWVNDPYHAISAEEFEQLCSKFNIAKTSGNKSSEKTECAMIAEPVFHSVPSKVSFVQKIRAFLSA